MQVGIDVLELSRMSDIANDDARLKKIFTQQEISYFDKFSDKISHITGNFCAKEAFVKALKIGFGRGINLLDVEVLHDKNGAPYINISSLIKDFLGNKQVDLSISHCDLLATAICIIY